MQPFKNYYSILIVFTMISILGIISLPFQRLRYRSYADQPVVRITIGWEDHNPEFIDRQVTRKIEGILSSDRDVSDVSVVIDANAAVITGKLKKNTDGGIFLFRIKQQIRAIASATPEKVSLPRVELLQTDALQKSPLIRFALVFRSDDPFQISHVAQLIKKRIAKIKDVEQVDVMGDPERISDIKLNWHKMEGSGISWDDVIKALRQSRGSLSPAGDRHCTGQWRDTAQSSNEELAETSHLPYSDNPLAFGDNRIVRLRDLSYSAQSYEWKDSQYRFNKMPALIVNVEGQTRSNTIRTARAVREEIQAIAEENGGIPEIFVIDDQSRELASGIRKISLRAVLTLVLLMILSFVVYRDRTLILVVLSGLLASLSIAIFCYYLLGTDIDFYSLNGITLSLGIMVDNSIVMVDHVYLHRNRKVFIPLLAGTLTTLAAMMILGYLPNEWSSRLQGFRQVFVVNVVVSLIVSLLFIPSLMNILSLKPGCRGRSENSGQNNIAGYIRYLSGKKMWIIAILVLSFGIPIYRLPDKMPGNTRIENLYNELTDTRLYRQYLKPGLDVMLGGSLRLFDIYVPRSALFDNPGSSDFMLSLKFPETLRLSSVESYVARLEQFAIRQNDVVFCLVRRTGNFDFEITIRQWKEKGTANPVYGFTDRIVPVLDSFGGLIWTVSVMDLVISNSSQEELTVDYLYEIKGYNLDILNQWVSKIRSLLESGPRFRVEDLSANPAVNPDQIALNYELRRRDAHNYQAFNKVEESLRLIQNQNQLVKSEDGNIIYRPGFNDHPGQFWSFVNSPTGLTSMVRPGSLLGETATDQGHTILKSNQNYFKVLNIKYLGSRTSGSAILEKTFREINRAMPAGFRIERRDPAGFDMLVYRSLIPLILLAYVIYTICGVLFNSVKLPMIILGAVISSISGVFLTFYLFRLEFNEGGIISLFLCAGLVVNASIYILNLYQSRLKSDMDADSAILLFICIREKIRPVSITIISTLLGLLPFIVIESRNSFWFSLASGTAGGLVLSFPLLMLLLTLAVRKRNCYPRPGC